MPSAMTRPSDDDRIRAALWFADRGFGIFPVWSTRDDGTCRCPAGRDCSSPGKHPITHDGFKDATTDSTRIGTFLRAASHPNYGMVPPEAVFVWDVDTDEEREHLATLSERLGELPATLRSRTAHGEHVFWRWPDDIPRPLKRMFGLVTRWGSGRQAGYVVGPRSVHASGFEYAPAEGSAFEIVTLPEAWARAAVEGETGTVTVAGRPDAADVSVGHRHDFLRDTARLYAGTVRDPDALFAAVWADNVKLAVPKSEDEVRRAIGDVLTRFPADPVEENPETGELQVVRTDGEPPMMSPSDDETLFPVPPSDLAFGGLLGECVDFLAQGTDASRVGLLASLVAFCGPLMPVYGYWHGHHTSSPFLALVGKSGIGRKGTAMYRVRDALANTLGADTVNRMRFEGIASGEALVKALLDRQRDPGTYGRPTGVLFEEEYATFLAASGREGSNLDPRMRSAFDGKQLAHRKVSETIVVAEPYWLSGLVAITPDELQARVTKTSFRNGSGNRWLWLPVGRRSVRIASTEPIFPLDISEQLIAAQQATLRYPIRLDPGPGVDDLLSEYDEYLRAEVVGLAADMTRRYGVIAYRIALVHAAVDRDQRVGKQHVMRAIALAEYARAGLGYCFGDALGDENSTHLLRMLLEADDGTLPQWTISKYFIRDPIKRQAAIDDLVRLGLAEVVKVSTRGRRGSVLRLLPHRRDFCDFCALIGIEQQHEVPNSGNNAQKSVNAMRISPAEAAQKVRRSLACQDYVRHQSSHRREGSGWVCDICEPPSPG